MCFSCKFAGEEAFFAGEFQILFDYDYYDTFVTLMMTTNSNEASTEDLVVPLGRSTWFESKVLDKYLENVRLKVIIVKKHS